METLKANAAELLGRQDVQEMVETLKKTHPALVDELIPAKVSLGMLHRVLQRLLRERVPIRDLVTILEALGDAADSAKDPEAAHRACAPRARQRHRARIHGRVGHDPRHHAGAAPRGVTHGTVRAALRAGRHRARHSGLPRRAAARPAGASSSGADGRPVPLIVPPGLRVGVRRLVEPVLPALPVISLAELPPFVGLNTIATWEMRHAA